MRLVAVDNVWRQPYSREGNHISQYYLNMWRLRDHRFHLGNIIGTAYQFIVRGKNFVVVLRLQTQNGVGIFRRDSWKDAIPTAYFWH